METSGIWLAIHSRRVQNLNSPMMLINVKKKLLQTYNFAFEYIAIIVFLFYVLSGALNILQ